MLLVESKGGRCSFFYLKHNTHDLLCENSLGLG